MKDMCITCRRPWVEHHAETRACPPNTTFFRPCPHTHMTGHSSMTWDYGTGGWTSKNDMTCTDCYERFVT